ncbi:MAG: hypothetical protein ACOYJL_03720 [Tractidigestivibacter sp.]|uniref:hypothetical protein n=1 Tax=Tractidigestivibacter sp. TaxID=2847320 RepID=UPI003D89DA6A
MKQQAIPQLPGYDSRRAYVQYSGAVAFARRQRGLNVLPVLAFVLLVVAIVLAIVAL